MKAGTAVVITGTRYDADPRHWYWSQSLSALGYQVIEIEIVDRPTSWRNKTEVAVTDRRVSIFGGVRVVATQSVVSRQLLSHQPETTTGHYIHRSIRHLIGSLHLIESIIDRANLIVAIDFPALVALLSVGSKKTSDYILYDAQEIFTDQYDLLPIQKLSHKERAFWIELETLCISYISHAVTVSPGIADLYAKRHGITPTVLPNYVPVDKFENKPEQYKPSLEVSKPVRFVFMGRADPHRGLEKLVMEWNVDPTIATLNLIIPHSRYRQKIVALARSHNSEMLDCGLYFSFGVNPKEMITTLTHFDVGIIPYDFPYPYSHCSPNKLGEYAAAGLPVIVNNLPFLCREVTSARAGICFDWNIEGSFSAAVRDLCDKQKLQLLSRNMNDVRQQKFSWNAYFLGLQLERAPAHKYETETSVLIPDEISDQTQKHKSLAHSIVWAVVRHGKKLALNYFRVIEPMLRHTMRLLRLGGSIQLKWK